MSLSNWSNSLFFVVIKFGTMGGGDVGGGVDSGMEPIEIEDERTTPGGVD